MHQKNCFLSVKGLKVEMRMTFFFHLQVIGAEDVLQGIETFGWSMSGAVDMDLNQYPGKIEKNLMKDIASIPYEP